MLRFATTSEAVLVRFRRHTISTRIDGFLVESAFQIRAIALPPGMIEFARHHLEHDDVVVSRMTAFFPNAFGWRTGKAHNAAEALGQLCTNTPKSCAVEAASRIVGKRKENLNQMHRHSLGTPLAGAGK
jgi:hypothetical protein